MNVTEILALTKEADVPSTIMRFAELIAAQAASNERERCAKICDAEIQVDITHAKISWDSMGKQNIPFPQSPEDTLVYSSAARCAAAIRALSNKDAK